MNRPKIKRIALPGAVRSASAPCEPDAKGSGPRLSDVGVGGRPGNRCWLPTAVIVPLVVGLLLASDVKVWRHA